MTSSENDNMKETLMAYKNMALDKSNHPIIMKDKTMVQFLAYSLDTLDPDVVEASLQTIDLLTQNSNNHSVLKGTFGLLESLQSTFERADLDTKLKTAAKGLYISLSRDGPAYSTRSKTKTLVITESCGDQQRKLSSNVYKFLVFGLNNDTRNELENVLVRVRGVISVVVDVEHQRCIVRAVEKVTPEYLAETVCKNTNMEAHLIVLNKNNQEVLKNVLSEENNHTECSSEDLPQYLAEEESPVKDKAILSFDCFRTNAGTWFKTATTFLQNSFYW